MHTPPIPFAALIIVIFAVAGLSTNKWLKFGIGAVGIVVLVSGLAGVFG